MRNAKPVTVENLKFLNSLGARTDARSVAVAYQKLEELNNTYREKILNTHNQWGKGLKAGYLPKSYDALISHHFRNYRHDANQAIKPLATVAHAAYWELNRFIQNSTRELEKIMYPVVEWSCLLRGAPRRAQNFKAAWVDYEARLENMRPQMLLLEREATFNEKL